MTKVNLQVEGKEMERLEIISLGDEISDRKSSVNLFCMLKTRLLFQPLHTLTLTQTQMCLKREKKKKKIHVMCASGNERTF